MSHTNSTPNYSLPQFLTGDRPAWMADINAAMSAIDTGMKANADAATAAQLTADKAVLNGAPGYSNLSTYDVDDVVNYQGRVYKCIIAVTTPEAFDNAKWFLYDLQDASKAIDDIDLEIGSGDISGIGDGSVKGAILEINNTLTKKPDYANKLDDNAVTRTSLSDEWISIYFRGSGECNCDIFIGGVGIGSYRLYSDGGSVGTCSPVFYVPSGVTISYSCTGATTYDSHFVVVPTV